MATGSELPLRLTAPLGSIGFKDRAIFDMKFTLQDEYKFSGKPGEGFKWKKKVESYFITCAPVLM